MFTVRIECTKAVCTNLPIRTRSMMHRKQLTSLPCAFNDNSSLSSALDYSFDFKNVLIFSSTSSKAFSTGLNGVPSKYFAVVPSPSGLP
jgi:hypothetical protein